MFYKAPEKDCGLFKAASDEFLHNMHMLSRARLFFELALSVICCCLMK